MITNDEQIIGKVLPKDRRQWMNDVTVQTPVTVVRGTVHSVHQ